MNFQKFAMFFSNEFSKSLPARSTGLLLVVRKMASLVTVHSYCVENVEDWVPEDWVKTHIFLNTLYVLISYCIYLDPPGMTCFVTVV